MIFIKLFQLKTIGKMRGFNMSMDNDTWLDDCIYFYNGHCRINYRRSCKNDSTICTDYEQEQIIMQKWLCEDCKKNLNCKILIWQNKINNMITVINLANEQRVIIECKYYEKIEKVINNL